MTAPAVVDGGRARDKSPRLDPPPSLATGGPRVHRELAARGGGGGGIKKGASIRGRKKGPYLNVQRATVQGLAANGRLVVIKERRNPALVVAGCGTTVTGLQRENDVSTRVD